jgi:hypothetical protein
VIPQISLVVGPCAGGGVYSPVIMDFTVMVDQTSHVFITGPDVIEAVTGEDVGFEELGGARSHNSASGVAHHMAGDEKDAVEYVKQLLSYLSSNNRAEPLVFEEEADLTVTDEDLQLDAVVPASANQPYDMRAVIEHVLDDAEFFETQPLSRRTSSPYSCAPFSDVSSCMVRCDAETSSLHGRCRLSVGASSAVVRSDRSGTIVFVRGVACLARVLHPQRFEPVGQQVQDHPCSGCDEHAEVAGAGMGHRERSGVEVGLPERHGCGDPARPRDEAPVQHAGAVVEFADAARVGAAAQIVVEQQHGGEGGDEVRREVEEDLELGLGP